jgi:Sulfotransferase family
MDEKSTFGSPGLPPRAAFVVGMMRSGTTLLRALIQGHPQVMMLARETKTHMWRDAADPVAGFFKHSRYAGYFAEGTAERDTFETALRTRLSGPTDVVASLRAVAEAEAMITPPTDTAEVWIEKTPDHLKTTPALLAGFGPSTRFVCMMRDPRAQMASRALRWKLKKPFSVASFARGWAQADEFIRHLEATTDAFLVVRYEDLVTETQKTMERVAEHLGLFWNEILLVPTRDDETWQGNSSYSDKPSGVSTASLDRWTKSLDESQVQELEDLIHPRMPNWSYEPRTKPAGRNLQRWVMNVRARRGARKLMV